MPRLLRKCSNNHYTMKTDIEYCPICNGNLVRAHPARFSPNDRFAKYRAAMRKLSESKAGDNTND